jgi:hypothetical protein
VWEPHGARLEDFDPRTLTPPWQGALAEAIGRTRRLFEEGRGLCDRVGGRLRIELRLTWLGGMRVLERVRADGERGRMRRPALGAADALVILCRALVWRRAPWRDTG